MRWRGGGQGRRGKKKERNFRSGRREFLALSRRRRLGKRSHIWSPRAKVGERKKVATLAGIFPKKSERKEARRGGRGWRARIPVLSIFLAPRTNNGDMQNACVHVNRYPLNCIPWKYAYCALNGPCAATRVVDFNYCNDSQSIINRATPGASWFFAGRNLFRRTYE